MKKLNAIYIDALTLIELIVVISIIGILVTLGFPAYQTYLIEARRMDAINALRENQLTVENYLHMNGTTPTSLQVNLLTTSAEGFYSIDYTRVDDNRYKLVATADSSKSQTNDTGCTILTLSSEMDNIFPAQCH